MPSVSVIIPAYGHAKYILETLDSVISQTYTDYEVIVVNDGSPDNTADLLRPLVDAGRIRYFEIPNGGVAAARNFGISQAKGEFIALLDDDDLWPPDKLEWQVKYLWESDAVAVGGAACVIGKVDRGGIEPWHENKRIRLLDLFSGNPFLSPGQVMFRRVACDHGAEFDSTIWGADDLDFWMELAGMGAIDIVARDALYYRLHETNASSNKLRMLENSANVIVKRLKIIPEAIAAEGGRRGYDFLFNYLGKDLVWEARDSLLSRTPHPVRAFRLLSTLYKCFSPAARAAPETHGAVVNELKIAFFRSVFFSLKQRVSRNI